MPRKRNGSSFSFTKFFDAVVPNLFEDNFCALDERSFFVAGVVDAERTSKKTYKTLQKHEIIKADGKVDTMKIGPKFLHQLSFLDTYRQRELVNMLFWWHEECQRFVKLVDEDTELTAMIIEAERHAEEDKDDTARKEMVDQIKFAREWVRMKIRQQPAQRRSNIEANTDDIMERFRGRSQSAPLLSQADSGARGQDELPPSYNMVRSK